VCVCVFFLSLSLFAETVTSFERVFGIGRKIVGFLRFRKSLGCVVVRGCTQYGQYCCACICRDLRKRQWRSFSKPRRSQACKSRS
jgi:hypothetical protein